MKNKRLLSFLTVVCILAALCAALIPAASAEAAVWNGVSGTSIVAGSGTSEDPYLIRDPAELDFIAASAVGGEKFEGKYFRLETDVDWGGREWTPIGTKAAPFGGVFDGNGKTVYNFTCTDTVPGLFGYATGAEIKNLKVDHAVFTTDTRYAGALVGLLRESRLSSCAVGENVVVTTESMMSSTAQMGGVCGLVNNSTVTACVNYGRVEALNVNGTSFVGGIAGVVGNESTLVNCMNVGPVSSPNKNVTEGSCAYVGGIAGGIGSSSKSGVLEGCVNTGEVSCVEYAGGVVGRIHVAGSALNNCSNLGAVRGGADMSGSVVGLANKEFTASGNMGLSGSAPAECANTAEGVAIPAGAWSTADEAAIKASDAFMKTEGDILSLPAFAVVVPVAPATEPVTEPMTDPATVPATEPATKPVTKPATDPVTEPGTVPVTEPAGVSSSESAVTEPAKGGCGSSVAAVTLIAALLGGAVLAGRRKN